MDRSIPENKSSDSVEVSLTDLIVVLKKSIKYIRKKWIFVLTVTIFGALLGMGYAIVKKPIYSAVCTFVLEDGNKGGSLGQYASLASIAGINIGDGGGGIFEGDNIFELYTSRAMIKKTLLSYCYFDNKKQLLIDRFIDSYKLRKIQGYNISFNNNPDSLNRKQDSIITSLTNLFNDKLLNVTKLDKKLSIIKVEVITKDELFSKEFTDKLVQTVNDFYVQTKTDK